MCCLQRVLGLERHALEGHCRSASHPQSQFRVQRPGGMQYHRRSGRCVAVRSHLSSVGPNGFKGWPELSVRWRRTARCREYRRISLARRALWCVFPAAAGMRVHLRSDSCLEAGRVHPRGGGKRLWYDVNFTLSREAEESAWVINLKSPAKIPIPPCSTNPASVASGLTVRRRQSSSPS